MKIIYKQNDDFSSFESAGIKECRFKELRRSSDNKKLHHHTEFEIHIISDGFQIYKANEKEYRINAGELLFIPGKVKHQCTESSDKLLKYAVTFKSEALSNISDCILAKAEGEIFNNIEYILKERRQKLYYSPYLIKNRAFETLITILRLCGLSEEPYFETETNEDTRISIAREYIKDNIQFNPKVSDVAEYCYLSTKQLTRLFIKYTGQTPGIYITTQKVKAAEKLLSETFLSLKEISEVMNFSNEYHFNAFFKKYSGMPPGEFRKMVK